MRWNRVTAIAGLVVVLLAFVEFFGPSFPLTSDSAGAMSAYFTDHHRWMLAAVIVQGVGNALWLVFLAGIAWLTVRSGAPVSGLVAVLGGALNTAISLVGLAVLAALAFDVADLAGPTLTKGLFTYATMTLVLSNFMLALMTGAIACAPVARWFRLSSGLAAIVFLIGGAAFSRHGALSPDGAVQFATYGIELAWTVAGSVLLLRTTSVRTQPGQIQPADLAPAAA